MRAVSWMGLCLVGWLLLQPSAARADTVAVQVKTGWSVRGKTLGAFLRYEFLYRRSAVFHEKKSHQYVPRAFGLGTKARKADWEMIIDIPRMSAEDKIVEVGVTIREPKLRDRLLREGQTLRWEPVRGWEDRKISIDLDASRDEIVLTRQEAREEIEQFFRKLSDFKQKHEEIGNLLLRGTTWVLDTTEERIDETLAGMVQARAIAQQIRKVWQPPKKPAERPLQLSRKALARPVKS